MRFELNVENQNVFLNFENNWCSLSVDVGFEAHLMIFVNRHVSNRYLASVFNDFEFQIEPNFWFNVEILFANFENSWCSNAMSAGMCFD